MAKVKWNAKQAELSFAPTSSITLDGSTTYDSQFNSAGETVITAYAKDITVTPPELSTELIHTLGSDAQSFQNSYVEEKPAAMAKVEGTLVMQGDEIFETMFTGTANVTGYMDYYINTGQRNAYDIFVHFSDGTDEIAVVLHDGFINLGDRKPTAVDGHWEQGFSFTCRPNDYREQFKD